MTLQFSRINWNVYSVGHVVYSMSRHVTNSTSQLEHNDSLSPFTNPIKSSTKYHQLNESTCHELDESSKCHELDEFSKCHEPNDSLSPFTNPISHPRNITNSMSACHELDESSKCHEPNNSLSPFMVPITHSRNITNSMSRRVTNSMSDLHVTNPMTHWVLSWSH